MKLLKSLSSALVQAAQTTEKSVVMVDKLVDTASAYAEQMRADALFEAEKASDKLKLRKQKRASAKQEYMILLNIDEKQLTDEQKRKLKKLKRKFAA